MAKSTEKTRVLTLWRLGLVLLSGVLGTAAFPLAFPVGARRELFASGILEPLAFVCLVPTLAAVRGLRWGRAFGIGYLAGVAFFTGAFWWVNVAMTTFGGMPNVASIPALLMLASWCAIHWGLAFGICRYFAIRHGWSVGVTLGPVWMATELMRNYFCSGFPWANLGYSQMRNLWFSQVGSIGGVYLVAFCVALVNGALYELLRWRRWKEREFPRALVATAAAVLVLGHVYGAIRVQRWERKLETAERVRIAVVQGNIDQKLKNAQGQHSHMVLSSYNPATEAADKAGADLIVWPEAAFPRAFQRGTPSVAGAGLSRASYRSHLLLGVDVFDPADYKHGSENAAYLLAPDLRVQRQYTKHHLVPFGEYILFDLDKYLPIDNLVPGTFKAGKELTLMEIPLQAQPGKKAIVAPEICFDAIFPEISRRYAAQGAQVLVNLTNDAWYGYSSAPYQFLRMVAMRAVETGRPVARAANTGISAFIDPLGRISQPTPIGLVESDEDVVDASRHVPAEWRVQELPLLSGSTPYVVIGDVPAYLASLFCVLGIAWGILKARQARRSEPALATRRSG